MDLSDSSEEDDDFFEVKDESTDSIDDTSEDEQEYVMSKWRDAIIEKHAEQLKTLDECAFVHRMAGSKFAMVTLDGWFRRATRVGSSGAVDSVSLNRLALSTYDHINAVHNEYKNDVRAVDNSDTTEMIVRSVKTFIAMSGIANA